MEGAKLLPCFVSGILTTSQDGEAEDVSLRVNRVLVDIPRLGIILRLDHG